MQIRRLKTEDAPAAKKLWLEAFPEDIGAFSDFYFARVFQSDVYYGLFDQEKLASMAGIAKRQIRFFDRSLDVNLLRGVATAKAQTGKGFSSELLKYILRYLYEIGAELAILKTYIHPFYERLGFCVCSHWRTVEAVPIESNDYVLYKNAIDIDERLLVQLLCCYRSFTAGKNLYLLRTMNDMKSVLEEALDISGCVLITCTIHGNIRGYCIATPREDSLYGEETIYPEASILDTFAAAAKKLGKNSFYYKEFDKGTNSDAMARAISIEKFLKMAPLKIGEITVRIDDPILPDNSGMWNISRRKNIVSVQKVGGFSDISLTPGEIAALALGSKRILAEVPENIKAFFDDRKTGIFEQY